MGDTSSNPTADSSLTWKQLCPALQNKTYFNKKKPYLGAAQILFPD